MTTLHSAPATDIIDVTLDQDLDEPCRFLRVATPGDVEVVTAAGETRVIPNAYGIEWVSVTKVLSANTTASGIQVCY